MNTQDREKLDEFCYRAMETMHDVSGHCFDQLEEAALTWQLEQAYNLGMERAATIVTDPEFDKKYPELYTKFMADEMSCEEMEAAAIRLETRQK